MKPKPIDDDIADALARAQRAYDRAPRAWTPAIVPPVLGQARHLSDRAVALLAGGFGAREVDRCRADDPGQTMALDHARRFVSQREQTVLLLIGGTGCGKTTAATWVAREIGGSKPGMIDATELERRGRYDHGAAEPVATWLASRSLVVIDDLGVEPTDRAGYFVAMLDEVVNRAYKHRRRLVMTSNVAAATLKARLGERIWSRVCESGTIAECGAVDLRRGGK